MQLSDAAHASHSDWVIRLARRQASRIMDENRASHYEDAARWLQKMARAYKASGQAQEWEAELRRSFSSISGNISSGRCWRRCGVDNLRLQQGLHLSRPPALLQL